MLKPKPINPRTVRYKIAQFFLWLLFGRKHHYLSPWRHSSIATTIVLVKDGKVLMGKRRGNIEYPGLRDNPGGHLNLETNERIVEAGVREVYEETRIHIDPQKITQDTLVAIQLKTNVEYIELKDGCNLTLTYAYVVSDEELETLEETDESHDFQWFSREEIQHKLADPDLHFIEKSQFGYALKAIELIEG
jgi:8-oxo-dGTP pyrophosphatase MutT (NUDIX family)